MEQIGFFPFANPSNIYGMTSTVNPRDRTHRILVATMEKQVFSIEYSPENKRFHCNEIHFAYLPSGADVISIDAFARSNEYNDICLGITFFKNTKETDSNEFRKTQTFSNIRSGTGGGGSGVGTGNSTIPGGGGGVSLSSLSTEKNQYYFNIYSSLISTNGFDLNQIAQDCQPFELDFVPYHLYHTSIINEANSPETLWLLSGSDHSVHIFREDVQKQCFYQEKTVDLFPELNGLESIVLWIDVFNLKENRLSAVGCENGAVHLFHVEVEHDDTIQSRIVKSWFSRFDGPVLSVKFFNDHHNGKNLLLKEELQEKDDEEINLLVMNSYDFPVVYRNVYEHGLKQRKNLYDNSSLMNVDIFLANFIGDFNFDRNNEILLGTFGKKMMVYKYDEKRKSYSLERTLKVSHPISSISYLDLTGDGINELVIVTTKGIIIYRHRIDDVLAVLSRKLDKYLLT